MSNDKRITMERSSNLEPGSLDLPGARRGAQVGSLPVRSAAGRLWAVRPRIAEEFADQR
jgi:hypothetical protein